MYPCASTRDEKTLKKKPVSQKRRYKKKEVELQDFINGKNTQLLIILLVAFYTLLIFLIIALEDLLNEEKLKES